MSVIPDFSESELWTINTTLTERYGEPVEVQLAESEMRLNPLSTEMASCPTVYWRRGDCHFVIIKTGDERYRAQFFYRVHKQYGTGIEEYDNISDCVVTLLQVQSDHERDTSMEAADR